MTAFYHWVNDDLSLNIKVQPGSSRDEFTEIMGETIKIRITAPPVDGKANRQLMKFLSNTFKVAKSQIEIVSGKTGRYKQVIIKAPRILPDFIHTPDGLSAE